MLLVYFLDTVVYLNRNAILDFRPFNKVMFRKGNKLDLLFCRQLQHPKYEFINVRGKKAAQLGFIWGPNSRLLYVIYQFLVASNTKY